MKKYLYLIVLVASFFAYETAFAKSADEVLPFDTEAMFEYNLGAKDPMENLIIDQGSLSFATGITSGIEVEAMLLEDYQQKLEEIKQQKAEIAQIVKEILNNNTITFAFKSPETILLSVKITDSQYQNLLDILAETLGTKFTKTTHGNYEIYKGNHFLYFTKIEDILLAAPTEEEIISVLDALTTVAHLNGNPQYKQVKASFLSGSFFNIYVKTSLLTDIMEGLGEISLKSLLAQLEDEGMFEDDFLNKIIIITAYPAGGISLRQSSEGFAGRISSLFIKEKLQELGLDPHATSFIPLLYKYFPSKDPIFYVEGSNLKAGIEAQAILLGGDGSTEDLEELGKTFEDMTTLNFEKDFMPLLEKEYAFLIQNDTRLFPAFTLLLNTSAHVGTAQTLTDKIIAILGAILDDENISYNASTTAVKGKTWTTFTFDLKTLTGDPEIATLPKNLRTLSLTFGVTPDGYLLISSYSKIAEEYDQGLDNNSTFMSAFENLNLSSSNLLYLSIKNIAKYAEDLLKTMEEATTEDLVRERFVQSRGLLEKFAEPWNDISYISHVYDNYATADITVRADVEPLFTGEYFKTLNEFNRSMDKSVDSYTGAKRQFTDTPQTEWYYQEVRDLSIRGVAKGYPDKTFKPERPTTRAEFLTMVLRAFYDYEPSLIETGLIKTALEESPFKDVKSDDWFAPYVDKGYEYDIIKGFPDKTFRPNQPITRAEATKILFEVYISLTGEETGPTDIEPFGDVKSEDWFYDAIRYFFRKTIVQGVSANRFEPHRAINRAEAAKLINKTILLLEMK